VPVPVSLASAASMSPWLLCPAAGLAAAHRLDGLQLRAPAARDHPAPRNGSGLSEADRSIRCRPAGLGWTSRVPPRRWA